MSGAKCEAVMAIRSDVDVQHVQDLSNAITAMCDKWHVDTGKPANADEIIEALLCGICEIIQQGPDELTRAMLAQQAMRFIMRNSNINPFAILEAFVAATRTLGNIEPQGTA